MSANLRGSLAATTALALVGSLVAAADVVEGYPLAAGQALRYLLAAGVLLLLARGRLPRLSPREAVGLAALAATGLVLFNLFVIEGVRETDPATVGVIVGCVPVVLALAGPLPRRDVGVVLVVTAGLAVLGLVLGAEVPTARLVALEGDRKSTRLNSSDQSVSRMPSSA